MNLSTYEHGAVLKDAAAAKTLRFILVDASSIPVGFRLSEAAVSSDSEVNLRVVAGGVALLTTMPCSSMTELALRWPKLKSAATNELRRAKST